MTVFKHRFSLVIAVVFLATSCTSASIPAELVYIDDDGGLILANLDLGRMTVSSSTPVYDSGADCAAWSPDGQRLAFITGEESDPRLHVGVINGSSFEAAYACRIGLGSVGFGDVSWAPDGDWLIVSIGTHWIRQYELYALGDCELVEVIQAGGFQWSPDGKHIMYARPREVTPFVPWGNGESMDLVTYDLATGNHRELLRGTSEAAFFPEDWPEAQRAFISRYDQDRVETLFSIDPTAEGDVSLTPATLPATGDREAVDKLLPVEIEQPLGEYTWHPEGTAVAVTLGPEIWILRPDGNGHVGYFKVGPGHAPAWRPD